MGEPKPRRQRKGILDALTGTEGGFTESNLTLISKQIADLQQGPPAVPDIAAEPSTLAVPKEPASPTPLPPAPSAEAAPSAVSAFDSQFAMDMPQRKKGARHEKASGLHVRLEHIKQNGFDHPVSSRSFLMVPPDDFLAILSLEPLSVVQVVFVILRGTIGWEDPAGLHGRREWVRLSAQDFERRGIAGRAQARRGLKRAEKQGYIQKRAVGRGYEYAIRWSQRSSN